MTGNGMRTALTRWIVLLAALAFAWGPAGCSKEDPAAPGASKTVVLKTWDFAEGIPADWLMNENLVIKKIDGGMAEITTVPGIHTYQVWSAYPLLLRDGEYQFQIEGELMGPVWAGVEDIKAGTFIVTRETGGGAKGDSERPLVMAQFPILTNTEVGVRLYTAGGPEPITFRIRRARIVQIQHP